MKTFTTVAVSLFLSGSAFAGNYSCKTTDNGTKVSQMSIAPADQTESLIDLSRTRASLYASCKGIGGDNERSLQCSLMDDVGDVILATASIADGASTLTLSATHDGQDSVLTCVRQ